ncbi:MAG TPA: ester cyclase [Gammaproteobacteria bacterium]|nr:ester cyclase [Gammaproteobacteria bacterium]
MSEENKALAHRFHMDIFQQGNLGVVYELISPDFVWHAPATPPEWTQGPEGVRQAATELRAAYPDLDLIHEDTLAEGDRVMIRWIMRGTHNGPLMGIPATGKPVTVVGIDVFRVAGGQIVELWQNFDQLGMLQQLGVIPTLEQQGS